MLVECPARAHPTLFDQSPLAFFLQGRSRDLRMNFTKYSAILFIYAISRRGISRATKPRPTRKRTERTRRAVLYGLSFQERTARQNSLLPGPRLDIPEQKGGTICLSF